MEYLVVLKKPFARAEVVSLVASGIPFLGSYPLGFGMAFLPGTPGSSFGALLAQAGGQGFGPRQAPRFENANAALYEKSARGGKEVDYYDFGAGRVLVYDHRIRYAYWQPPIQTAQAALTPQDYAEAARDLGIEPEIIQAFAEQESPRGAFQQDGQPTILFERHKMYRHLKKDGLDAQALTRDYPEIVNTKSGGYGKYAAQYDKLNRARALDESAALQSASWGRFQIMGENYRLLYKTPQDMEKAMRLSEKEQLAFFVAFVRKSNNGRLLRALKNHQWERAVTYYNGANWRTINPQYANNIRKFYEKYKREAVQNQPGLNRIQLP